MAATASQVQTGSLSIAAADGTSGSIIITDVIPTRAFAWCECSGGESGSGNVRHKRHVFRVYFTESVGGGGYDRLTWARYEGTFAQDVTMRWYVVELDAASSCQSVNLTCTADPTTTTSITAPSASYMIVFGVQTDENGLGTTNTPTMDLTQTTNPRDTLTIDFTAAPASGDFITDAFIVDFGTANVTRQVADITVTGTNNSGTALISALTGEYAIPMHWRQASGTGGPSRDPGRVSLSGTTVTVNCVTFGTGGDRVYKAQVIEFIDSTNVVTGLVSLSTSQTSNTATSLGISDAARCTPIVGSSWQQGDLTTDSIGEAGYFHRQEVSGTTLTVTRSAHETSALDVNFFIIEWQQASAGVPRAMHSYRQRRV